MWSQFPADYMRHVYIYQGQDTIYNFIIYNGK